MTVIPHRHLYTTTYTRPTTSLLLRPRNLIPTIPHRHSLEAITPHKENNPMSPITIRKRPIEIHTGRPVKIARATPTILPRRRIIVNPIRLAAVLTTMVRRTPVIRRVGILPITIVAGIRVPARARRSLCSLALDPRGAVGVVV